MVKLSNGTEVDIDEFITWSSNKQAQNLIPQEQRLDIFARAGQKKNRAVMTPIGEFPSCKSAMEALGICANTLRRFINNDSYPSFYYINEKPDDQLRVKFNSKFTRGKKITVTPLGTFNSKNEAMKAHGVDREQFAILLKNSSSEYYFLLDNIEN